jgi:hypothetical protein
LPCVSLDPVSLPAISSWEGCWCVPCAKESQYLLLSGTRTVYTTKPECVSFVLLLDLLVSF